MNNARFEHKYQAPDGNRTEVRGMTDVPDFPQHPSMLPSMNADLQVIPNTSYNASTFRTNARTRAPRRHMQVVSAPRTVSVGCEVSRAEVNAVVINTPERHPISSHLHAGDEEELDGGNANEISKRGNPKSAKPVIASRPSFAEWNTLSTKATPPTPEASPKTVTSDCDEVVEVKASQVESDQCSPIARIGHTVTASQAKRGREISPQARASRPVGTSQRLFGKSRKIEVNKPNVNKGKHSDDVEFVEVVDNAITPTTHRRKRERPMSRRAVDSDSDRNVHPKVSPNVAELPNPPRRSSARLRNRTQPTKSVAIDKYFDGASNDQRSSPTGAINLDPDDEAVDDDEPNVSDGVQMNAEPVSESVVDAQANTAGPTSSHLPEESVPEETEEEPITELFDYPPTGRGKIRITSEELKRLRDHQYLNDSLIDFYVKYLEMTRNSKRSMVREKASCLFFSSFFFGCLRRLNSVDYDGVKRWTNNVDLFEKQFVFVPLCDSYHWSLIIVANLPNLHSIIDKEIAEACEAAESMGERRPKIIYMDSLAPKRGRHFGPPMIEYLAREWIHRKTDQGGKNENTDELCDSMFKKLTKIIKVEKPPMPEQSNEYDCGLYVLKNMECFLDEVNGMREEVLANGSKSTTIKTWYTHSAVQKLRTQIMCLIKDMESCFKSKRSLLAKDTSSGEQSPLCITGSPRAKTPGSSNTSSPFAEKKETPASCPVAIEQQIGSPHPTLKKSLEKADEAHEAACVFAASELQMEDELDLEPPRNASELDNFTGDSPNLQSSSDSPSGSTSRIFLAGEKEVQERKVEASSAPSEVYPMDQSPSPSRSCDVVMQSVPIDEGDDAMIP